MRKSLNDLDGIVRKKLKAHLMSRLSRHCSSSATCNRHRNQMKVLVADESGMWVLSKRLDGGTFAWMGFLFQ